MTFHVRTVKFTWRLEQLAFDMISEEKLAGKCASRDWIKERVT